MKTSHLHLPSSFSNRIVSAFGEAGVDWLQRLPSLLKDISSRWEISVSNPFEDMAYNFVAPAVRRDGTEVVLKVGVPRDELSTEIAALKGFNGRGAVRLLEYLPELGAFLIERLKPGMAAIVLEDDQASTQVAIQVMQRLWNSDIQTGEFPRVSDWAIGLEQLRDDFRGGTGPFPRGLVESAEGIYKEYLNSMDEPILLHGDLHHWNILSAEREKWLAIDPKGIIGEPAYEVGAWLRNPFPNILTIQYPERLIARRIDQFSEFFGFERERLLGWGLAQTVLAAWWSYTEGDDLWKEWIECAQIFTRVKEAGRTQFKGRMGVLAEYHQAK